MKLRRHSRAGIVSRAWYAPCMAYRYGLERVWQPGGAILLFVMLNPSTATELVNDPTIARCQARAARLGYGGVRIANLFAYRATRPQDLRRAADPVGPRNDAFLCRWLRGAGPVVAAWGVHGTYLGRDRAVIAMLGDRACHLGLTKAGHPRHPLYVSNDTPLTPFVENADA